MQGRIKRVPERHVLSVDLSKPSVGYPIPGDSELDPDNQYTYANGLALGGRDYEPFFEIRGLEIHGAQSEVAVKVLMENGSIHTFDNLTIVAGGGWVEITGKSIFGIYANGTTATGIHPLF